MSEPAARTPRCQAASRLMEDGEWWEWGCTRPRGHQPANRHEAQVIGYKADEDRVYVVRWTDPEFLRMAPGPAHEVAPSH